MKPLSPTRGSRRSPEQSQRAILDAACREFANEGVAGARTDAIAKAAGVNKALLYYYFRDKESLYGAVLQHALGDLLDQLMRVLDADASAGYRVLAYAVTHFDFVCTHPEYRRLIQFEMMRAGTNSSPHFEKLIDTFFRPLMKRVISVLQEGIDSGEFRPVQPQQFMQSMVAVIVFYFTALPAIRALSPLDPLAPEALQKRRVAILDFISGALFEDRSSAARVAAEVLRDIQPATPPLPEAGSRKRGKKH
jgi:TetR/AcrR family transcriptional regulator